MVMFNRGVQVLEKNDDLDEHIAAEDVVYLLLHQPSEEAIMVSPCLMNRP